MPIEKLLVANRGEIAIRVMRAARELGIVSVAVHSPDDAASLHVRRADEARALPGAGARGYLDIEAVIAAAKAADCDAVHPGYGFLAENAAFARRCSEEGITFVGPSVGSLELFGDKAQARNLAVGHDVPVLPGSADAVGLDEARSFFDSLGEDSDVEPAMVIKAIAGGGGRGMRIVTDAGAIEEAYTRAQSEAGAAFGNDAVFVERLIARARHIEVQVDRRRAGRRRAPGRARVQPAAPPPEGRRAGAQPLAERRDARSDHRRGRAHGRSRQLPEPGHLRVSGR